MRALCLSALPGTLKITVVVDANFPSGASSLMADIKKLSSKRPKPGQRAPDKA